MLGATGKFRSKVKWDSGFVSDKRGIKRACFNQVLKVLVSPNYRELLYDWLKRYRLIFSTNQMRLADTWFPAFDKFWLVLCLKTGQSTLKYGLLVPYAEAKISSNLSGHRKTCRKSTEIGGAKRLSWKAKQLPIGTFLPRQFYPCFSVPPKSSTPGYWRTVLKGIHEHSSITRRT